MIDTLKSAATGLLSVVILLAGSPTLTFQHGSPRDQRVRSDWTGRNLPGTLMFGGGCFIDPMGEEFVKLAGGDQARLVIVPIAYGGTETEGTDQFLDEWKRWGPTSVEVLFCRDKGGANEEQVTRLLQKATGVWFTGGDQSRLLDLVQNTRLHRELYDVLRRGGVVGGNCAGAMVLGELMIVRGKEPVVLRRGLNVAQHLVIDAHLLERNRIERLRRIVQEHPRCIGLGIDRETAVVLQGGELRFVGKSYVTTVVPVAGPQAVRIDVWAPNDVVQLDELLQRDSPAGPQCEMR